MRVCVSVKCFHAFHDELFSVELALGSSRGRTDIKPFRQHPLIDGMYVMSQLALTPGSEVFVSARVTNAVNLYTIGQSEGVVISPEPRLEVFDGGRETDLDGQTELHVLQGSWRYSDPCPVLSAEWSAVELGGKTVLSFTAIPDNSGSFYNDSLRLENLKTYVNYVRLRDALNRTRTAFSDGVTVLLREPDVGAVRDGLGDDDADFQEPVDRLSANWDYFGNPRSTLPSDRIVRYEAAVGTDRRYRATRSDVHAFEDVGLSTNVSFFGLNLTAKSATYYVTVRAFSGAGSYVDSSSDGIRAGYSAKILPGQVRGDRYQSSVNTIRFSWEDFRSDIIISHYYSGISSSSPAIDNGSRECSEFFESALTFFDVSPLKAYTPEQTMAVVENVILTHGEEYYVTLVAVNQMGQCSAVVSRPILVDVTPPVAGNIHSNGFETNNVMFLHSSKAVQVDFNGFHDPESGVQDVEVSLFSSDDCSPEDLSGITNISSVKVTNESLVNFLNLDLQEGVFYFVRVTVTNGAGLETRTTSRAMFLDLSPPLPGSVKLASDWTAADETFQSKTDIVTGLIAIKPLSTPEECVTQTDLLDSASQDGWVKLGGDFSDDCVEFDASGLHVLIQHNPHLTGVDKGAVQFTKQSWREGDYVFRVTAAAQEKILSGISLASSLQPPFVVQNGIAQGSQLPCDPSVQLCLEGKNDTTSERVMRTDTDCGVGLTFLEMDGQVKAMLWVQDELQLKRAWIPLDFNPANTEANYVLRLKKASGNGPELWGVTVLVNGEEKVSVSGLVLSGNFAVNVYTWNIDGFMPQVVDPFQPFRNVTSISAISLPVDQRPACSYSNAFQDPVSGIREILLGVSDSYDKTANIAPFKSFKSFCMPCLLGCNALCSSCGGKEQLTSNGSSVVFPVYVNALHLQAADVALSQSLSFSNLAKAENDSTVSNSTADELGQYQLPTYYLDVRVIDHSGWTTDVKSAGLVVDTSPPVINYVRCFDPHRSKEEAILFLGNNYTVGVLWDASEDVSDVLEVRVSLGTQAGLGDVMPRMRMNKTQAEHIFTDFRSPLEEGGVYFVTVEVQNVAGLTSQAWSNFTVHTIPPDLSAVTLQQSNVAPVTYSGVELGLMESTDRLEINLGLNPAAAGDTGVEYYGNVM